MGIIVQQGTGTAISGFSTTVQDIMNCTAQDVRQVLSATTSPTSSILLDYTNRISLQTLRYKNWKFLTSAPQLFLTQPGVTDYWVGPSGTAPVGTVDTGLNLSDVHSIKKDMVFSRSTYTLLHQTADPPLSQTLESPFGQKPLFWRNDSMTPQVLNIYPYPDGNDQQPNIIPSGPVVTFVPGGALPARTYYVFNTFTDTNGGESLASPEQAYVVPANMLLNVRSPILVVAGSSPLLSIETVSGPIINSWNLYVGISSGSELTQALSTPIGTDVLEPVGGFSTSSGNSFPGIYSLTPLGGYVVEFRYFRDRTQLTNDTQLLQIPDDYIDVMCAGVNWLAYKYLKKDDEAQVWQQVYARGLIEMVKDSNLFPRDGEFIHPDPFATTKGNINTGVGLDSNMETSIP
jgi:hypothetical protein